MLREGRISAPVLVACHVAALSARAVPRAKANKRTGELLQSAPKFPNPQKSSMHGPGDISPSGRLGACQLRSKVAGMIVNTVSWTSHSRTVASDRYRRDLRKCVVYLPMSNHAFYIYLYIYIMQRSTHPRFPIHSTRSGYHSITGLASVWLRNTPLRHVIADCMSKKRQPRVPIARLVACDVFSFFLLSPALSQDS